MFRYINRIAFLLLILPSHVASGQDVTIQQHWAQVPVLKHKAVSPVLQVEVDAAAGVRMETLSIDLTGTTHVADIDAVLVVAMGADSTWHVDRGEVVAEAAPDGETAVLAFTPRPAAGFFVVALRLTDTAPLDHVISARLRTVGLADGTVVAVDEDGRQATHRIGLALRQAGDDGVVRYRIPGLARTNNGTLLALYDVRRDQGRDLQGNIDVGISRSTDGGKTWEPMRIALDMGAFGGLPEKFNGVSDANILVDPNSDAIYVIGCWMHGVIDEATGQPVQNLTADSTAWNHQWQHNGSLPGFDIERTSQFLISTSTDDGQTWSKPVNVTRQVKRAEWHLFAPAPGSGIALDDGTLVIPTQGKDENQVPFSTITYSTDGGQTWQSSNPSYSNTTENMVVQLSDGRIMQNMRDNRNRENKSDTNGRAIFVTADLGATWEAHPTHHRALIEPVCMGALYKHTYTDVHGATKSVLLFSNPNSKYHRNRMTIKVSFDDGNTWPEAHWLLLDELALQGGYSSLASVSNDTIGIVYEGSQAQMTFERISLDELGITDAAAEAQ